MRSSLQKAILKTIIYADVFDYPLTFGEIEKWTIGIDNKQQITKNKLKKIKLIGEKKGLYFLRSREKIVGLRLEREKYSREKLKIAQQVAGVLKIIPSVKCVGITGALAVQNVQEDDDIDLFVVTSKDLLWTTRFLSTLTVEMTGMRRHPGESDVNNKICLNMFVDEDYLRIPRNEQDLFSAHEVAQLKPLLDRDNTYQKFLVANKWVKKYLPNAVGEDIRILGYKDIKKKRKNALSILVSQYLSIVETILREIQIRYMQKRLTKEVITRGIIRFHPQDAREWVMKNYKNRLKEMNL